jgi:O-antigen/teichoic acid export membrane protein
MMVAAYLGLKETGIYTTVVFITAFMQVPYRALTRMTIPLVAEYWKAKDMVKMAEIYKQVSSVLLVVSTTMFMYVWINREAVFYILKPEFVTGIPVFLYIMVGRLLDMYLGLNGAIFVSSKKYAYDLIFTFLLVIIVYVLNTILIPVMGMSGAALGTMIALVVYNLGRAYFVWAAYKLLPFAKSQLLVLILFALNCAVFELIPHLSNRWLDILLRSILFTMTYPFIIYVFKIEKEINNYLDKIIPKYLKKSN